MDKQQIQKLRELFEGNSQQADGVTFWYARDLQKLLGYSKWDNFIGVIAKAKDACTSAGYPVADHFAEVGKMVDVGSGATREIEDIVLSRYACYLIAQNGDSKKTEIAFAQTYFAMQTRKQELLEERLGQLERLEARHKLSETEKKLSGVLYEHGVDDKGFALVRSRGDEALFGLSTAKMKQRLGVKDTRPLADFLPTVTLKAKELAAAITGFNVKKESLSGLGAIVGEHITNNEAVRGTLVSRGIVPEDLPAEEDIKKVERKVEKFPALPASQDVISIVKKGE